MPNYRLVTSTGGVPLAGKELLIGSSPDCQVRAAGPEVASHHARIIVRDEKAPLVEPVAAGCEVFIDGQPVARRAELAPGSVLRVGTTELHLELATAESLPPVKKKRPLWRRLLRFAAWCLGIFLLLVALVAVLVPFILSEARVKGTIKDYLEEELRRDVTIGGVELRLLEGLKITGLTVANKEGFTTGRQFLAVKEVDVRVDVWRLLRTRLGALECSVKLKEPAVFLERGRHGATNIDDLLGGGGGKKKSGKKGKKSAEKEGTSSGPLGPVEHVDLKLAVEKGVLEYADRYREATSRVEEINFKAELDDFDVPALEGGLSYELGLTAPAAGGPGEVKLAGGADFAIDPGKKSPLGFGLKLTGELLDASVKNLDPSALARHLGLAEPARDVSLQVRLAAASLEKITLTGTVEIPQLETVALGINDEPKTGLGAKLTLVGAANPLKGDAELTLRGTSPLWEKLEGSLSVEGLAALVAALASGGEAAGAEGGSVRLDLAARADIGKLTGGEVGKIFKARDRVEGKLDVSLSAEGTAAELPARLTVALRGLEVPARWTGGRQLPKEDITLRADLRLDLDPETLALRGSAFSAVIDSIAVKGRLTGGKFAPASGGRPAEGGGGLELSANLKQLADRYGKVLEGLPEVTEDITVRASASGSGGRPIHFVARVGSRRAGGRPDPVDIKLECDATQKETEKGARHWDLTGLELTAKTPQSPSLDLKVTGQVLGADTDRPEFELTIDERIEVAALWDRLAPVLGSYRALEKLAALELAGRVSIKGGRISGTPAKFSSQLAADITGLAVKGPGLRQPISDAKTQIVANLDLEPKAKRLLARKLTLKSSFCELDLSGDVQDYGRMLGTYRLNLDADAGKTTSLLEALGLIEKGLDLKGKAAVTLTADTARGTAQIERCLVETKLARLNLSGKFEGLKVERLLAGSPLPEALEGASGEIRLDEFSADLAEFKKLRKVFGGIPRDLTGEGTVSVVGRLRRGSEKEFSVELKLDASAARLALEGLVDKPARVPAIIDLAGSWDPAGQAKSLRMKSLAVRLGDLALEGSGAADVTFRKALEVDRVEVRLNVPEFEPEKVRALVPALADFRFGGSLRLADLRAAGSLKQLLESKRGIFSGRLAGLAFKGRAELKDLSLEYAELPKLALRAGGAVDVDTDAVVIKNLALGAANKESKYESRLVIRKGRLTSAKKGARLLADLGRLAAKDVELAASSVKVEEILAALEAPGKKAPAKPGKPPAGGKPEPAGTAKGRPYEFLRGHRLAGSIKIDRVTYEKYALADLTGRLELKENVFRVTEIGAKAYGGEAGGSATADFNGPKIAHSGKLDVKGVDINAAAAGVLGYKDIFHGKAGGELSWSGTGFEPGKLELWKGGGKVKIQDGEATNLEELPLFGSSLGALAAEFGEKAVREIYGKEHRIEPTEIGVSLAMEGRTPVLKFKNVKMKTVSDDPMEVAFLGGFAVLADARGDRKLAGNTRLIFLRLPQGWLKQARLDKLADEVRRLAGGLRKYFLKEDVRAAFREAVSELAAAGKVYQSFGGTVSRPGPKLGDLPKAFGGAFKKALQKAVQKALQRSLLGTVPAKAPGEEPGPEPKPEPKPEPAPGAGRLEVTGWDVGGGNFLKPKAKVKVKVFGPGLAKASLFSVAASGSMKRLASQACKDGQEVYFNTTYNRLGNNALEIRLYNEKDEVVARLRRAAR